ncbi:AGE family epimerase/isomerase [Flavilitoribacter nigricans]|uniref:N-acylglucosamine 2-epimerase n=1 Tax=Flavilitoribacter nigricans (strain ATCC 23147 / DSM 23189 / NBRC 102662 / NCIMB 1420 / SS-2) TaxID=1122177 RepID=A0A2D0MYG1_FLAN2|nr:AGE family epimerase/isomerase [Flavilitoribacter nigricans]PHN01168.1 N-acylglucosamine 2-epimerase [Flavilitoribacter nigricans DSM 23189 = NBRC 102662]
MRTFTLLAWAVMVLAGFGCGPEKQPEPETYLGVPVAEIETELEQLMALWYPRIVDTVNGGYLTNFERDWTPSESQNKMLVTQARGLWTAARAAAFFPDRPVFREAADAGFRFLTEKMWDTQYGGFYQYFPPVAATPSEPSYKMTYSNAFALFALAEYARINPEPAVMDWVRKAFQWLESRAHDPQLRGYYNLIFDEPLSATDTAQQRYAGSLGWGKPEWKDQNTSIHVLEALSTTYQVLPEPLVGERLAEMLHLVRDTMVNEDGYLHLYFTKDWEPISHRDSSRAYILDNLPLDHQSFGHDIETGYLLIEASESLNDGAVDAKTLETAKALVDHTLAYGFDQDYYGLFDRGYRFPPDREMEIVNNHKVWWAQAEAWHALGLMTQYFPNEKVYEEAFRKMWDYIQKEMIDPEYGGWYANGLDTAPESISQRKAHQWKGAYHNGRALFQVLTYARESTQE